MLSVLRAHRRGGCGGRRQECAAGEQVESTHRASPSSGHRFTNLFEKGGDDRLRVSLSERLDREEPAIAGLIDDRADAGEIDWSGLSIDPHIFLDLPGAGIGYQLLDFGIWIALANAADV